MYGKKILNSNKIRSFFSRRFRRVANLSKRVNKLERQLKTSRRRLKILESAIEHLLSTNLGLIDHNAAFNAQRERIKVYKQLINQVPFTLIIETGTKHGATTQLLATLSPAARIHTSELNDINYLIAAKQLESFSNITCHHCDTRELISLLAATKSNQEATFFYLDAHWYQDLPLLTELDIIFANWPDAVIMIDDFKVPHDEGYQWYRQSGTKELSLEYINTVIERFKPKIYFPSTPSSRESGAISGYVLLARGTQIISQLEHIDGLTKHF